MNRIIKFRGKSVETGEWVYGDLIHRTGIPSTVSPVQIDDTGVDPETVGQFTGLTDRSGKEIYEGDIFKTADSNGECLVNVYWDEENARILGRDQRGRIWYVGREPRAEVIGNVHDNPESIKSAE